MAAAVSSVCSCVLFFSSAQPSPTSPLCRRHRVLRPPAERESLCRPGVINSTRPRCGPLSSSSSVGDTETAPSDILFPSETGDNYCYHRPVARYHADTATCTATPSSSIKRNRTIPRRAAIIRTTYGSTLPPQRATTIRLYWHHFIIIIIKFY